MERWGRIRGVRKGSGGNEEGLMKEQNGSAEVLTRRVKGVLEKGERENISVMD